MSLLAVDTETYLIAPGRVAPRLVCVSTFDGTANLLYPPNQGIGVVFSHLNRGGSLTIHNASFDMAVLVVNSSDPAAAMAEVWKAYEEDRIRCTRVREKLWQIATGEGLWKGSLADCVKKHLGETVEGKTGPDIWRLRYCELDGVPLKDWPDAAREYALLDAKYHWRVFQKQQQLLSDGEYFPDEQAQTRNDWALHLTSAWGLRTDPKAVKKLVDGMRAHVEAGAARLQASGIWREGTYSKNEALIREKVSADLGDMVTLTDGGKISIALDVLEKCTDPDLLLLADVSEDKSYLSKFAPVIQAGTTCPICCRYNPLVATGRTSASKPNVQQMPRRPGVRECFCPRPGNLYIGADYQAGEMRSFAQVCIDLFQASAMADSLREGLDLHLVTAGSMLGLDYETIKARYDEGDPEIQAARQLCKIPNFGFLGGMGGATLARTAKKEGTNLDPFVRAGGLIFDPETWPTFGVTTAAEAARLSTDRAEAFGKQLKRIFVSTYPEAQQFWDAVSRMQSEGGGAFTLRQLRSGRIRGGVRFTDGCNSYFQGLTADGAKLALYRVTRECFGAGNERTALYGFRPVIFMHDEIICEGPAEQAPEAALRLSAVMSEAMAGFTPDIPSPAEPYLMRRWYKGAEAAYSDDGRLVPWEPPPKRKKPAPPTVDQVKLARGLA